MQTCLTIATSFVVAASSKSRPEENSLDMAIITECKNVFYMTREGKRVKTEISLFKFSIQVNERRKWINAISPYRRNGSGDT